MRASLRSEGQPAAGVGSRDRCGTRCGHGRRTADRLWTNRPGRVTYARGMPRAPAGRSAVFFDLDKTVIAKSSTLAFGKPFYQGGLINRRAVLKSSYAQFVYLVSGADDDQMDRMRSYLKKLCAGWDVEQVREIVAETLHDLIDPLIYDEAAALIEEHRAAGRDVVLVSSSGEEVVAPIGAMVGADRVAATRSAPTIAPMGATTSSPLLDTSTTSRPAARCSSISAAASS